MDEFRSEVTYKIEKFQVRQDKLRAVGYKEIVKRATDKHQQWLDHFQVSSFKKLIEEPCEVKRQIHRDWAAVEGIIDALKFYSVEAVTQITAMFLNKWVYSSENDDPPNIIDGKMIVHYKRHIDWFLEHRTQKGVVLGLV